MRRSLNPARLAWSAAALLLAALPVLAQFPDDVPENARFRLGGIFATLDSRATLSTANLPGTVVDFSDLGITPDHKTTFQGEGYWNFLGRSYLDFGYVDFDASGSHAISRDINFGGAIYKAGATVDAESRTRFIYAAYRFGIFKNPTFHFGLSLGVSYYSSRASLAATAGVTRPDGSVIQGGFAAERELNLPVPVIGAEAELRLFSRVTIGARFRGLKANVSPYSGSYVEAQGSINWYFARNFGIGGAYDYHHIRIERTNDTSFVRFDQIYDGPRGFLVITF